MVIAKRSPKTWAILVGIGVVSGYVSGLFGVGGGTIIVPLLLSVAAFDVRLAHGTSLAAIVPTAIAAVSSYAVGGSVDWIAAALICVGSVTGAQIGSKLLSSLPKKTIRWIFIAFLCAVIVSMFIVVSNRESRLTIDVWLGLALAALGLAVGICSGLLGVGGGIIVVPMLIVVFGASDLIAKGTSLAMMIPTAISGTVGNVRRKNVDIPAAACIGLGACATTWLGAMTAAWVDPFTGNVLFALFQLAIVIKMVRDALKKPE
ncbi:MAG: sulfite exporter TauE/SafE family protein [Propionibacteriaceae bacterium]|nr:sulfite exporter TauE/SafE family protein [Propionibacteriaceae bacterium]